MLPNKDKILKRFNEITTPAELSIIVIYSHPTDYPDSYVARLWIHEKRPDGSSRMVPTVNVAVADTLDEIRKSIPEYKSCFGRKQDDDPVIVETWI